MIITACVTMLTPDRLLKVGIITDGFVRLSVGMEDPEDLVRSLDEALTVVLHNKMKELIIKKGNTNTNKKIVQKVNNKTKQNKKERHI
mmetsp:Transcript_45359/g.49069  ORF Transcript_45359/g.49069 Transcript_45359/m.49069 type:complete len:88 (-) Transcript_45359:213-476(-)